MLGAIAGDIIGSIYELKPIKTMDFPLFQESCFFTDDTVMTVAVARALMEQAGKSQGDIRKAVIREMKYWGNKYPDAGYGSRFIKWLQTEQPLPYNSWGNGSAMRVSAVGWLYQTLDQTLNYAKWTADVTHNHPEGIKGAQAVAAAIYLLRSGKGMEETKRYVRGVFGYAFHKTLAEIRPTYVFDVSCQGSVPQAMTAFFESNGFEDCIRKAVSLGGDSDTIAAIAGSLAEAYYGIPEEIQRKTHTYMDEEMIAIYCKFLEMRR
jgi:ADP-ribosylglycohydrolase